MTHPVSALGVLLTLMMTSQVTQSKCPWEKSGLTSWSDASTWGTDGIPAEGKPVVIKSGMSVLLDVSPPPLQSVHIVPGAKLVWGHTEGLVLKTGHIQVEGEFLVGKDTRRCRMDKKATIILTGKRNSDVKIDIEVKPDLVNHFRKTIMVLPGGSLEMHGEMKKSWTKLAATIPSVHSLCGTVFDIHQNTSYKEANSGLHVIVWNPEGSVFDFNVFDTDRLDYFSTYLSEIDAGKIVGIAVMKTIGDTTDSNLNWDSVYVAMETLGAKQIRSVTSEDSYAFVVVKGQTNTASEALLATATEEGNRKEGPYVSYFDWSKNLQFSVRSVLDKRAAKTKGIDFKIFNTDLTHPIIKLKDDVSSWKVGDEIVVASTDFEWRQAEVKRLIECSTCQPNEVRVDSAFEYMHYGEITFGVDEKAEVGVLSRSVRVEGEMEESCYSSNDQEKDLCDKFDKDTYGGMVLGYTGLVAYHVQHVELYHMGQQAVLGSYPLHFHLLGDGSGLWFRNNSVHRSFQRCFVIHGTDNAEVSENVCYDHLGHGLFVEDSAEQNNLIKGNLILGTQHGTTLFSDRKRDWCDPYPVLFCDAVASYWITHPNNVFEDNVAAGSDNSGFWFAFADDPLGPSKAIQDSKPDGIKHKETRYTPIKRFHNNVAHSNERFGVILEGRISNGEEFRGDQAPENAFLMESSNSLDPREPNNENGDQRLSLLEQTTIYRNKENNMYARGGNVFAVRSSFADSPVGFYAAHSVDNTSVEVYDSLFVGQTANKGQPWLYTNKSDVYGDGPYPTHNFDRSIADNSPEKSITAVSFASGPVMMTNCYFDQFTDWYWNDDFQQKWGYRPLRRAGALSFRRRNRYPSAASNGVHKMKFGFCDNVNQGNWVLNREEIFEWHMMDGNIQTQIRDYDGSVTGKAGTQLVRDIPFLTADNCVHHDNWGISACPYGYAKVGFTGKTGVLKDALASKSYPVTMRRDDAVNSPLTLRGDRAIEFLTMKNRSYTVQFNGSIPRDMQIKVANMERGDVIRLGICLPATTTQVTIRSGYVPISKDSDVNYVTSMADLDADTVGNAVYHDTNANMLFFKLISRETRQYWQETCPGNNCVLINLERLDGDDGPRDCSSFTFPPYDKDKPAPSAPQMAPCSGPASTEGIGAPLQDETPSSVLNPTCIDVSNLQTASAKKEYVGCFSDSLTDRDLPHAEQFLYQSMTVQICVDRCRNFNYQYAGLQRGLECRCGNSYGKHQQLADGDCNSKCTGNESEMCGMRRKNSIYRILPN